jgi:hypothetical protein
VPAADERLAVQAIAAARAVKRRQDNTVIAFAVAGKLANCHPSYIPTGADPLY